MDDDIRREVVQGWGKRFGFLLTKFKRKASINPDITQVENPQGDGVVDFLLEQFDGRLTRGVPDAFAIWRAAQEYLRRGDTKRESQCQNLNYFLHNSHIPNALRMAEGVRFGYGGIGVIHKACEIGTGAGIEANVTLGDRSG